MLRRKIWRRKKRILVHFKSAVKYNLACKSATMYRCERDTTYKVYVSRAFRVPEERKYAMPCWPKFPDALLELRRKPSETTYRYHQLPKATLQQNLITEHPPLALLEDEAPLLSTFPFPFLLQVALLFR